MPLSNLFNSLANTKTRTMVIFASSFVIIGIIIAATQFGKPQISKTGVAQTLPVPSNIKAVPGNATPQQYQQLLQEDNRNRAAAAKKNDTSTIATLVGGENKSALDTSFDQPGNTTAPKTLDISKEAAGGYFGKSIFDNLAGGKAAVAKKTNEQSQEALLAEQRARIAKIKQEQREDQERARLNKQQLEDQKAYLASIDKINKNMDDQAKFIFAKWSQVTPQTYTAGAATPTTPEPHTASVSEAAKKASEAPESNPANTIKAGTILFGVLDTAVNSDEPGPILATIVQGEFKDARLIGAMQKTTNPSSDSLTLNFTLMNRVTDTKSIPISMVAIDPDTARTALASHVDYHYLLRYGSLFASAFLSGYGQAITSAGSVTTNNPGSNTTTTTTQVLSPKQQIYAAVGAVGTAWGQKSNAFETPNTITVNSGTGVGLLVLQDIHLQDSGS